jgi:D-alanyl-D-alanine carboxypeptidase
LKARELKRITKTLNKFAVDLMASSPLPGGTVAIVSRAGVESIFAFGNRENYGQQPTKIDDKYEIGSISKSFTGAAIYALVEDGKLSTSDEVTKYLPWFIAGMPDGPVTISQLLSHTAGFVLGADHVPDELAQAYAMRNCRRAGIGNFHYSNLGYMVLGQIIEAVTGKSVGEFLHERILLPLGTPDVRVPVMTKDLESMAVGHWPKIDDEPWVPGDELSHATWFEIACADGNIAANAHELSQFVVMLMNQGRVGANKVLSEQSVATLTSPVAPTGEPIVAWGSSPSVESSRYGHGVNVEEVFGNHIVTHGGGMVGYSTFMLADLTAGYGVVVLTNSNGEYPAAQLIARVGHDLLTNKKSKTPVTDARLTVSEVAQKDLGHFNSGSLNLNFVEKDGFVSVSDGNQTGWVYRTWNARFATNHPKLKRHHFYNVSDGWNWGSHHLTTLAHSEPEISPEFASVVGHYRSFSPWYTNFRIVSHSGKLFLVAPGGVEAQTDECELVEVAVGQFRIGSDPDTPETLWTGPVINGQMAWVNRDGAVYSRTFTL